jgi:hypothetical protein
MFSAGRLISFALMVTLSSVAFQAESETCPSSVAFSGEVRRGINYDYKISSNLRFHLRTADDGWYIEILPEKPGEDGKYPDLAWPLNPPYRGYNALNVSVSYDFTPKDVIAYPRKFRFPLDEVDAKQAFQLYEKLESSTGGELEEAEKKLDRFPSGTGHFVIIGSQLSPGGPANQNRGRIEWLKFEANMILPCRTAAKKP